MVVAKYYTKISIKRLSELLDLPPSEAEKQLSDLVVSKAIEAKVDRPSGIIQFGKRKVCVWEIRGLEPSVSMHWDHIPVYHPSDMCNQSSVSLGTRGPSRWLVEQHHEAPRSS